MRGFKLYIAIASALLLIYLIAELTKPVPTNWTPTFLTNDKIPFGTHIFYDNLGDMTTAKSVSKTNDPAFNTLRDNIYKSAVYMFIAPQIRPDSLDCDALFNFAGDGNVVFIAASDIGKGLAKRLKIRYGFDYVSAVSEKPQRVNFSNPALKTGEFFEFDKNIGSQTFLEFDTAKAIVLGITASGDANFLKYPIKKGAIFLLSDPMFFTNYNLLQDRGAEYAGKVMSYLAGYPTIVFDEYYTRGSFKDKSVLRFILGNRYLRMAYWLALGSFLVFLFYDIKRRQRIIPVADPLTNTSVEFVDVVTSLYFGKRDHRNIAEKKVAYFFDHLRTRYFWKVNNADKDFEELLINKAGISAELAKDISTYIRYVENGSPIQEDMLLKLNNLIESFFKESK